jgi:tRNA(Glu) U13 pseudouridine synthase TruD
MLDQKIIKELKAYINDHLIFELKESMYYTDMKTESLHIELDEFIKNNQKPTLQQVLFRFIDQKGVSDSEVYKNAGIDRKHFSKIRSKADYRPKKSTVIALGFGLKLDEDEFEQLLESGGYSLSDSETADLVIKFCLDKGIYDVIQVNEYLDYFSQKTLV